MCADGFLPRIVEDEPPYVSVDWNGSGDMDIPVRYFTCCPPYDLSSKTATNATRHCSDPMTEFLETDDDYHESNNSSCGYRNTQNYPRRMKPSVAIKGGGLSGPIKTKVDSFLCCDSNSIIGDDSDIYSDSENNTTITTNFLEDFECVPYRNEFYDAALVKNDIGTLNVISCDVPEGDFWFPRPVGEGITTRQYQCCKNGPAMPPFVQDSAFKITLYPVIALNCVAAVASAIVAIGLLIPLLVQLKNGIYNRILSRTRSTPYSNHTQSNITLNRSPSNITLNHSPSNITPGSSSTHQRETSQINEEMPRYNTFNLYLVYLALFDFIHSLCFVVWFGSYINQKFDPGFYHDIVFKTYTEDKLLHPDTLITYPYIVANVWINAIMFYQLLALLHTSQRTRRIKLPSLTRVNLQAGVVCLLSVIFGSILYFLLNASERVRALSIIFVVFVALVLFLPIVYVLNVTIVIWWRGYIPSANGTSPTDKAMRELALYFFRIVAVFMGIWIPLGLVQAIAIGSEEGWAFVIPWWFIAIQPILRTCMVLTKPDARKYILDLVTLSYLFEICTCRNENKGAQDSTKESRTRSVSHVYVASATADADGDADSSDHDANADADKSIYTSSASGADVADSGASDHDADGDTDGYAAADPETGTASIYPSRRTRARPGAVLRSGEILNIDPDGDTHGHADPDPEAWTSLYPSRRIRLRPIEVLRSGEILNNVADGDTDGHAAADPETRRTSIYPSRRNRVRPIADLRSGEILETTTKDNSMF
jgi:hypothetical protein